MSNSIMTLYPYKENNIQWMFDDESKDVFREAFVSGADTIIEQLALKNGIHEEDFEDGVILQFSGTFFPNYDIKVVWTREEGGGNWYRSKEFGIEGWLCPCLFKYFDSAPKEIYIKVSKK